MLLSVSLITWTRAIQILQIRHNPSLVRNFVETSLPRDDYFGNLVVVAPNTILQLIVLNFQEIMKSLNYLEIASKHDFFTNTILDFCRTPAGLNLCIPVGNAGLGYSDNSHDPVSCKFQIENSFLTAWYHENL